MRKIVIILSMILLTSCAVFEKKQPQEFVDQRFNYKFVSYAANPWDIYLTPETVFLDNRLDMRYEHYNCELLENRIGFVKMECQNVRYLSALSDTQPGHILYTFEMSAKKDSFFKGYTVHEINYKWSEIYKKWEVIGGDYYTTPEGLE